MPRKTSLDVRVVTPERWGDLERLFGPRGAYSNCWCGFWRMTRSEWDDATAAQRRTDLRRVVARGDEPGLLAYRDDEPVGWIAVEPRERYRALMRSPQLKPKDDRVGDGVWAVTCFFIAKPHRRTGVMTALLEAAVAHARQAGAAAIEGYPYATGTLSGSSGYMGLFPAYERAGFKTVARPSAGRRIMRKEFSKKSAG